MARSFDKAEIKDGWSFYLAMNLSGGRKGWCVFSFVLADGKYYWSVSTSRYANIINKEHLNPAGYTEISNDISYEFLGRLSNSDREYGVQSTFDGSHLRIKFVDKESAAPAPPEPVVQPEPVAQPQPVAAPEPIAAPDVNTRDNNGDSLLLLAVRSRQMQTVEELLQRGVDVNGANNNGITPLHEAAKSRDQRMVETLLQNHASPNAADSAGLTPVEYAASARNPQLLTMLIEAGGDPNRAVAGLVYAGDEQTFKTVLEKYQVRVSNEQFNEMIRSQRFAMAEASLSHGVDPNHALGMALSYKVQPLIEPALRAGANADQALTYAMKQRDAALAQRALATYNASPGLGMKLALQNNDLNILRVALQKGANANDGLGTAAGLGNEPMVLELLNGRADPNLGLMPAVKAGNGRIIDLLVTRGANPNPAMPFAVKNNDTQLVATLLRANADGRDPQLMATAAGNRNQQMVQMLLSAGGDPNAGVEAAVEAGSLELTRFLLESKADATNPRLIAVAARNGNRAIVTMLLERGADATAGLGGAVVGGQAEIAEYLLKNKADATDTRLIEYAASKGDARITPLLLTAGADPEAGIKPAVKAGAAEVVGMLIDAGASSKPPEYILSACRTGNAALAVALLKRGAPKEAMDERNQSLIHLAALSWKADLVKALLELGVDGNAKNQAGETALHIVARDEASPGYPKFKKMKKARLPVLDALIAGGVDLNAINNKGETVLKVADGGDVKDRLKQAGAVKDMKDLEKKNKEK